MKTVKENMKITLKETERKIRKSNRENQSLGELDFSFLSEVLRSVKTEGFP